MRYLAEEPKGVIVICHGYTESAPKYDELVYYFLQAGYHVYLPEHCGHGLSYRLTKDPSLVHIDNWKRYVRDFLHVCEYIRKKHPDLHLNLFAHSMGGAIGGIAATWKPEWFYRVILNSPMIRPRTANVPWVISASVSGLQLEEVMSMYCDSIHTMQTRRLKQVLLHPDHVLTALTIGEKRINICRSVQLPMVGFLLLLK